MKLGPFTLDTANGPSTPPGDLAQYHLGVFLLSLAVIGASSYVALRMLRSSRDTAPADQRRIAWLCASMVLGLGIWSMHFIGLQAMPLPASLHYEIFGTLLSIGPGMAAAGVAAWLLQKHDASRTAILGCSVLFGLAVTIMHYSVLATLHAAIRMDVPQAIRAMLICMVLTALAFTSHAWMLQHARRGARWYLLPSGLLALAVATQHYLSMQATQLVASPHGHAAAPAAPSHMLPLVIAAVVVTVCVVLALIQALTRYLGLWRAVAARDARLNAMLEAADAGFISTDAHGRIQEFNASAQRLFGYAREEVLGRSVSMLMPMPLAEQHDGYLHQHLQQVARPIENGQREVLGLHKDGRLIPLQLSLGKAMTPFGMVFVGYLQDISARKRADAQLRIAASVFHEVHEGVAIIDAHHNITDINPSLERLTGIARQACMGKPLASLFEECPDTPDLQQLWHSLGTQAHWQGDLMLRQPHGPALRQRISITQVLNEAGRPHHFIMLISDARGQVQAPGQTAAATLQGCATD